MEKIKTKGCNDTFAVVVSRAACAWFSICLSLSLIESNFAKGTSFQPGVEHPSNFKILKAIRCLK